MDMQNAIEDYRKFTKGMEILLQPTDISVGTTPSEVAYTEDDMKLLHYKPTVEKPYPVPVLIVYALVNRYYILDLQPDKSIVRKLLDEGLMSISSTSMQVCSSGSNVNLEIKKASFEMKKLSGISLEWKNGYSIAPIRQAKPSGSS